MMAFCLVVDDFREIEGDSPSFSSGSCWVPRPLESALSLPNPPKISAELVVIARLSSNFIIQYNQRIEEGSRKSGIVCDKERR